MSQQDKHVVSRLPDGRNRLLNRPRTARTMRRGFRMSGRVLAFCIVLIALAFLPGGVAAMMPVANFTANPLSGTAPLSVTFTDLSVNTTNWAWDFDNNGVVDNTTPSPVYTYTAAGTYSVNLTASNSDGSNSNVKSGYITVTAASQPDLKVTFLVPSYGGAAAGYVFEREPNTLRVTLQNIGTADAPASVLQVNSSDGFSGTVAVPAISTGSTAYVSIDDTYVRPTVASGSVTYTVTIDPDNLVAESDEANNVYTRTRPVIWNGYKGKALYMDGGANSSTYKTYDIHGGLVYSFGSSYYRSGSYGGSWTMYNVTWNGTQPYVPAGATVKEARLYLPYTWDNSNQMPNNVNVKFDGTDISSSYQHWYWDRGNFGGWGAFTYGLLTYDVTSLYQKNGTNYVNFTRVGDTDKLSLYGMTLAVVYEDQNASRKQIFINENFDLLGADQTAYATNETEAMAYLEFSGQTIDTANAAQVNLTTFVPSGEGPEGNLYVNGNEVATTVWNYGATDQPVGEDGSPQVAVDSRNVKSYLAAENNVVGIQSTYRSGGQPCMVAAQAFLIADYGPVAQFTATPLTGTTKPLSVTFTDQSVGATGWLWDFGDGTSSTEENPTHTYSVNNTYSVKLTVTGAAGTDYLEKAAYVQVGPSLGPLPGYTTMPRDLNNDGLYEDLTGNGKSNYVDLQQFFTSMDWIAQNEPTHPFDFSGNNKIGYTDLQKLFATF